MLNEFLNTIKGSLTEQLTGTEGLESQKTEGISDVITDTFKDGLQEKVSNGQLGDIISLFGQGGSSSSFAGSLINSSVGNMMTKLGLPEAVSGKIANIAIPFIIKKFNSFASEKGKDSEEGISDLLGDLAQSSIAKNLLSGLGGKLGF